MSDWKEVGDRVLKRRVALRLTQHHAAARAGVSPTTWRQLELGVDIPRRQLTLAKIEEALEWPTGAIDALLRGVPISEVPANVVRNRWRKAGLPWGESDPDDVADASEDDALLTSLALKGRPHAEWTDEERRRVIQYLEQQLGDE